MTPKEKAEELVYDFYGIASMSKTAAKQCALIAVDEILDVLWDNGTTSNYYKYWQEVKNEIEKL